MATTGPTSPDRLDSIRSLLSRLESLPADGLDGPLKNRIAQGWRFIESAERDTDAPWRIGVVDPQTGQSQEVGVGYHAGHGFDLERGAATLHYAAHRAALRLEAEAADHDLYDRVHAIRGRLCIQSLDRMHPEEEDRWYVVLDPGRINGRPRLPKTEEVTGASAADAIALARWKTLGISERTPLAAADFGARIAEMHTRWEIDDARLILPTIHELAADIARLDLALPDTPVGRRVRRMLAAVASHKSPDRPYNPGDEYARAQA